MIKTTLSGFTLGYTIDTYNEVGEPIFGRQTSVGVNHDPELKITYSEVGPPKGILGAREVVLDFTDGQITETGLADQGTAVSLRFTDGSFASIFAVYNSLEDMDYVLLLDASEGFQLPTEQSSLDVLLSTIQSVHALTGNLAPNRTFSLSDIPASEASDSDVITIGEDINLAKFSFSSEAISIRQNSLGWTIKYSGDTDTFIGVERIQFTDTSVAFDLDGHAGQTAKILGAVFGSDAVSNNEYAGIGLHYLDNGWSYEELMSLAIDAALGTDASPEDVVQHLYTNVVGVAPNEAEAKPFVDMLDDGLYSKGSLGIIAAETALNATNIDLIGLAETGLEYTPIS